MSDNSLIGMLKEIMQRAEEGEIIAGCVQYLDRNGEMWIRSVDGNLKVPKDMCDEGEFNYARLRGKGN
jgi:hypothetical protein